MLEKEDLEGMVKKLRKLGWLRSVLVILSLLLGIATGVWALSEKVSDNVEWNIKEVAEEVFDDALDEFHDVAQPQIMEEVDARIQIHSLEESQKTQEAVGQIQTQVSRIEGKLDILIERGDEE
jgi:hypothetical protein